MIMTARRVRAGIRLMCFLIMTLVCIPLYRISGKLGAQRSVAGLWFRVTNRIIGLRLRVSGQAQQHGPVLYVANHVSYLDIVILGVLLDAVFVAKQDVAGWPLFGRIASLGQCIFVTRKAAHVKTEAACIRSHLASGRNVILFPEGTTGDGGKLLPFKSALLGALDGVRQATVQPVTIAYPDLQHGGRDTSLAWYGDMAMLPHLWLVLMRAFAPARVHFHPALAVEDYLNRKALASACSAQVAGGLASLLMPSPEEMSGGDTGMSAWDTRQRRLSAASQSAYKLGIK